MDFSNKEGRTERRKEAGELKYKKKCNIALSSSVRLYFIAVSFILRSTLRTTYHVLENIDIRAADSNCYVHIAGVFRTFKQ